jgi:hypothetical protein
MVASIKAVQHHLRGTRNIISSEARTSLPLEAQMNDVEALPQMKLLSAIPYFSMVSAIV